MAIFLTVAALTVERYVALRSCKAMAMTKIAGAIFLTVEEYVAFKIL